MPLHHPDKESYPTWTLDIGNNQFHRTATIVQRMKSTDTNLAIIRAFLDALEWEYLRKRRELDLSDLKKPKSEKLRTLGDRSSTEDVYWMGSK